MPGVWLFFIRISSPGFSRAKPNISKPAATLATVAGAKILILYPWNGWLGMVVVGTHRGMFQW
jgi:hypothetical protein